MLPSLGQGCNQSMQARDSLCGQESVCVQQLKTAAAQSVWQ